MEYNYLCELYEDISIRAVDDKYGIPYTTFRNMLLAELWELVTEVGAKDTPRSSLKVCFGLSFIFNLFFSFQCITFNRLYTGQCSFCCRTRERIC